MVKDRKTADSADNAKSASGPRVTIKPLNLERVQIPIIGITQYVQNAFSEKAAAKIRATQAAGKAAGSKKNREPKDFDECYRGSQHISAQGWHGQPASGWRAGCISACRAAGFVMTKAKLGLSIIEDGYDVASGDGLVKITKGQPHMDVRPVRNDDGSCDMRARAMWNPGWELVLTVEYDADIFTCDDVVNLVERAGLQVNMGEGRNDSPNSCGQGWGRCRVDRSKKVTMITMK